MDFYFRRVDFAFFLKSMAGYVCLRNYSAVTDIYRAYQFIKP